MPAIDNITLEKNTENSRKSSVLWEV
ncbi:hypothetical protein CK1_21770 [Ruminococcus sp. SR1/5]|nr:hypothetical protein CK1_21770 [Ruminococcus sp. SR1/5]